MLDLDQSAERSNEVFVESFRMKYTAEPHLPLWMAAEIMSFGQLFLFFRQLNRAEQQQLAAEFGVLPPVLESWLRCLNYVRNACAHHARLWNWELPIRPFVPDKKHRPDWHLPTTPANDRIYAVLLLLRHLLRHVAPNTHWKDRLLNPSSAVGAGSENSFRGERFLPRGSLRGKLIFWSDVVPNTPL